MKKFLHLLLCLFGISMITNAQNNYNEISLPALMEKKQKGDDNIVIVDVRTKGEYCDTVSRGKQSNIGKIKGAINIPLQELQKDPEAVKQLDAYRDKDIYLICSHSYRSRSASNILLKNGFTHVNNVQGGMTEWFRRYDELAPYRTRFYETANSYKNISPAQLLNLLSSGEKVQLIGITNTPRFFWDSAMVRFYQYYPAFKNAVYFNYADSLKILEQIQKDKTKPVVLFNMVNNGAAETTEWLTQKGIPNAAYLVGNSYLFYEFFRNKNPGQKTNKFIKSKSNIDFITAPNYCSKLKAGNIVLVDLRHDSLYNKVNKGTKHDYKHLANSVNFFEGKGIDQFEQQFSDKKKNYVFISENGIDGLARADDLTKKGYTISWLIGGLQRWEWYMNNVGDFGCNDSLVK
ncbi:rhodanese-like domain-containing protein [Terrimonas alba]|uniref:rhodanese-like domain-containing protein n=1 Tax=Terrimonas alba TaxID=3349636 RepID=UPI0035F4D4B2